MSNDAEIVELTESQVMAWRDKNASKSDFAKNMKPAHFVGYTEDELNGLMLDGDSLSGYVGEQ